MQFKNEYKKILKDTGIVFAYLIIFGGIIFLQFKNYKKYNTGEEINIRTRPVSIHNKIDTAPIPVDIIQNGKTVHVPVLMYHHIGSVPAGADRLRYDLTVPTEQFEAQVKWF